MTRKQFNALADALKFTHPGLTEYDTPEARTAWRASVQAVAFACCRINPRFDLVRFIDACVPAGRVWEE